MIDKREEEILKRYQFWKTILKKDEHNLEDEDLEYCNSCASGCSGCSASCSSCSSCSPSYSSYQK